MFALLSRFTLGHGGCSDQYGLYYSLTASVRAEEAVIHSDLPATMSVIVTVQWHRYKPNPWPNVSNVIFVPVLKQLFVLKGPR